MNGKNKKIDDTKVDQEILNFIDSTNLSNDKFQIYLSDKRVIRSKIVNHRIETRISNVSDEEYKTFVENKDVYKIGSNVNIFAFTFLYCIVDLLILKFCSDYSLVWQLLCTILAGDVIWMSLFIGKNKMRSKNIKSKTCAKKMMVDYVLGYNKLPSSISDLLEGASKVCVKRTNSFDKADFRLYSSTLVAINAAILSTLILRRLVSSSYVGAFFIVGVYLLTLVGTVQLFKKSQFWNQFLDDLNNLLARVSSTIGSNVVVEVRDILLAYYSADTWYQLIFPEKYNPENKKRWEAEEIKLSTFI